MHVENLNVPSARTEMRINIKERPSWMKDEAFNEDILWGCLHSNTGCFIKVMIRDIDKKEKKKETSA